MLAFITFVAAVVNGALGYGFSSITVPFALLFLTNRVLNPALVLVEVVLNAYVLWVNRAAVPTVSRRVLPIVGGLLPGVVVGTLVVSRVAPEWVRFATFVVLLPLVLLQAAGYRRPIRAERMAGLAVGGGLGVLYSVTTISGPPLAFALNNQGLSRHEFRAALGVVRLTESSVTALAYLSAGLFAHDSLALVPQIVPSVVIGVPLGMWLIHRIEAETFRRICMSFDAWVLSFGVSTLLRRLELVESMAAYGLVALVVVIDAVLLARFFRARAGLRATS